MGEGFLDRIAERLSRFTSAKTVFGEPIERDGLTVIPVSKVRVRFRAKRRGGEGDDGISGAGGAAVCNKPIGYLEIRNGKTRFRPVQDLDHTVLAILGSGVLLYLTLQAILNNGTSMNSSMLETLRKTSQRLSLTHSPSDNG